MTDLNEVLECLTEHGYTLVDYIGSGDFTRVYTVRDIRYRSDIFCAKIFEVTNQETDDRAAIYRSELATLKSLSHPNIVSIYGHFASSNYYYLILEYCENGSLKDFLEKHGRLHGANLQIFIRQILSAVAYLHGANFRHRDIKPANILIDKYMRPKLADFGFSLNNLAKDSKISGSLPYKSPELILKKADDYRACDIWSLGVTIYQTALGNLPWTAHSKTEMATQICFCAYSLPEGTNLGLVRLIKSMMNPDPLKRGKAKELLNMPFVNKEKHIDVAIPGRVTAPGSLPSVLKRKDAMTLPMKPRKNQRPNVIRHSDV
jgi:aurora kinase